MNTRYGTGNRTYEPRFAPEEHRLFTSAQRKTCKCCAFARVGVNFSYERRPDGTKPHRPSLVRATGLEPARLGHWILNPTRLPFRHARMAIL